MLVVDTGRSGSFRVVLGAGVKYDRPVRELLAECVAALPERFERGDVLEWFRRHYPHVAPGTVSAHVQALTNGSDRARHHPGLAHYPPLLERVGRGLYRRAIAQRPLPPGQATEAAVTAPAADSPGESDEPSRTTAAAGGGFGSIRPTAGHRVADMTSPGADTPGTYRTTDKSRVKFSVALAAWVPYAYAELIETARKYHAVIIYLELSEHVQERSGIRTRMLLTNWIGKLLEEVAILAKAKGEPPLTSLCVHQDGTIGPGYARAPKAVADVPGEDIEYYAAEHRLLCYRKYAADVPADGGQPALTRAEAERRARKTTQQPVRRPLCPNCFTEVPASGRCDYCG
jgi:hypothetical protein